MAPAAVAKPTGPVDDGEFIPGDDDLDLPAAGDPRPVGYNDPPRPAPLSALPEPLPWFYGVAQRYAYLLIVLGSVEVWLTFVAIVAVIIGIPSDQLPPAMRDSALFLRAACVVLAILITIIAQFLVLVFPAVLLLFRDIGESLRQRRRF